MNVAQTAAALELQSLKAPALHRVWIVFFPDGQEVERKYQHGVPLSRVLSEHQAAVAAVPVGEVGR